MQCPQEHLKTIVYGEFGEGQTKCITRYSKLYNNQINARALIGQSAMFYGASNLMEKSRDF